MAFHKKVVSVLLTVLCCVSINAEATNRQVNLTLHDVNEQKRVVK